ncbi:kinase-like protein [Xylaria sp. CBS 124048]|nr:kinase-like protein [Xylaria sp. CBS 124048]
MGDTRKYITADEEIDAVPPKWRVHLDGKDNRVAFYQLVGARMETQGTYTHPVFGRLPPPWELRMNVSGKKYYYHNTLTKQSVEHGPRKVIRPLSPPPGAIRVRREGMGELVRRDVSEVPLYNQYPRIGTLDAGDGRRGGMNGGIYKVKSSITNQVYVEKVFTDLDSTSRKLAKNEIDMMRKLMHSSIVHYIDAYYREKPFGASVYMEYCDRGSLDTLLQKYRDEKKAHLPFRLPEGFIWHAFVGLADALGYLQTGRSFVSRSLQNNEGKAWQPIVHCDIKPANIFLRSRDTPGSTKPFYVLLSDFGLMRYEPESHDSPGAYGTVEWHAPELAFDPYPRDSQKHLMARHHTCKSDVWALACIMFCLCERDELAHLDRNCWPPRSIRALGRRAKRPSLDITDVGKYSDYLARTIAWAGHRDPEERPDGWELLLTVKEQYDLWVDDPNWKQQVDEDAKPHPWMV